MSQADRPRLITKAPKGRKAPKEDRSISFGFFEPFGALVISRVRVSVVCLGALRSVGSARTTPSRTSKLQGERRASAGPDGTRTLSSSTR